jgi:hypothetical protein
MTRYLLLTLTVIAALAIPAAPATAEPGDTGAFHADCEFSHRLPDDPIVAPGAPGGSHSHDFFGSRDTNANSTVRSIHEAETTCVRTDSADPASDRSAYWVPTLYDDGVPVAASLLGAYYTTALREPASIQPFPPGLMVIAGFSAGGPSEVNGERVWAYFCRGETVAPGGGAVAPTCATPGLELAIRFPDCSDGRRDSLDHKSHMAYAQRVGEQRVCPASHPTAVPRLQVVLRYATAGGPGVRLASGGANTAHADFVNAWTGAFAGLVSRCLVADRYCGGGDNPDK